MLVHRLALRNLLRNRRRSLLTALVVVSTIALMTVFQGLSDGGHRAMIDVGVRMGLGHLVLHQEGYVDDPSLHRLLPDASARAAQLRAAHPEVSHVVPRLRLDALVQAGGNTVAITVSGVEPEREVQVSGIADARAITQGHTLAQDAALHRSGLPGIVVGERLARTLGVALGDRITLTVKPAQGSGFSREAFQLVGVFRTGMLELDSFWGEVALPQAQRLAGVQDKVSVLALTLRDEREIDAVDRRVAATVSGLGIQIQPWNEAAPELHSAVALDAAGMSLLQVIVVIVVAAGILNTVVLSVMRRSREFGVMLALGSPPSVVVRVVLLEAIYLTTASLLLGLAIGLAAHGHFAQEGLNFRDIFGTSLDAGGVLLPDRFYSLLNPRKVALSAFFVFALTLLVSTLPALKASRQSPLQAIRHA